MRYMVDRLYLGDEDPLFVVWDPDQRSIRLLESDPGRVTLTVECCDVHYLECYGVHYLEYGA